MIFYPVESGVKWTIGPANSTPDPSAAPWRSPMDLRCPHCGNEIVEPTEPTGDAE